MKIDFEILSRYLKGKDQQGDKEKIMSWFSSNQIKQLRENYQRYWDELSDEFCDEEYNEEIVLGKIYHKIKLHESSLHAKQERKPQVKKLFTIITRVAAVLFIPLSIFILINSDRFFTSETSVSFSEIYAPTGTRAKFNLPDGSSGYLNGGSTLKFPIKFSEKSRNVSLQGEAYFDVVSNPKKPFIVSGSKINVVAYGTSFNVDAYPGDNNNKAVLVKGKIEVFGKTNNQTQSLGVLNPGEMCSFDIEKSSYKIAKVDADKIVSWKDGKLVFINAPFEEVVKKLNRRYSANIVIKDQKLKTYTYLATFEDETLDEVLKLIQLSAPISVTDLGRKSRSPDGSFNARNIEFYLK